MITRSLGKILPDRRIVVLAAIVFSAASVFADDTSARAKLLGTWQAQDPASKEARSWSLERNGDTLRVTHLRGDQKITEFECNTMGRECVMKGAGKPAKISMWFSGYKLVALETKGQDVVKRRFAVAEQGDTLELEVIPILPQGKTETLRFERVQQ